MNHLGTIRNITIVLLIAAAVEFLPSGGRVANTFAVVLLVAFYTGVAYLGQMLYREHRVSLFSLGSATGRCSMGRWLSASSRSPPAIACGKQAWASSSGLR